MQMQMPIPNPIAPIDPIPRTQCISHVQRTLHNSTTLRRRRCLVSRLHLLPLYSHVFFPLEIDRPRKQGAGKDHSSAGPVSNGVHAELTFQCCGYQRTDKGEDGNARPHHARPLPYMTLPFVRDEVRHARRRKGEHRASEYAEDRAEGDCSHVVGSERPEKEG